MDGLGENSQQHDFFNRIVVEIKNPNGATVRTLTGSFQLAPPITNENDSENHPVWVPFEYVIDWDGTVCLDGENYSTAPDGSYRCVVTATGRPPVSALRVTASPTTVEAGVALSTVTVETLDDTGSIVADYAGTAVVAITGWSAPNGSTAFPREFTVNLIGGTGTLSGTLKLAQAGTQTVME